MAASPSINLPLRQSVSTTLTEVAVPTGAKYLKIRPITITGYLQLTGGSDGGALGANYETFGADASEWRACDAYGTVWIAGSSSGTIEITFSRAGQ